MEVLGCLIEDISEIEDIIGSILDGKVPTDVVGINAKWLLVHQDDGVVWGLRAADDWRLSSNVFPSVSPVLSLERIQQLRVFGEDEELLVWRNSNKIKGRLVRDLMSDDHPKWAERIDDAFILLGDRVIHPTKDGFTLVGNTATSRQAIPISCTNDELSRRTAILYLALRHYLTQDARSGCVRIAMTRLLRVYKEERK